MLSNVIDIDSDVLLTFVLYTTQKLKFDTYTCVINLIINQICCNVICQRKECLECVSVLKFITV